MKLSAPIYRLKRQAKQLSRQRTIPLNEALDSVAKHEGFRSWSLLATQHSKSSPAANVLAGLNSGDLVLLGARPGHGKTLLGLQLIVEAVAAGDQAAFYSLEYTEKDIAQSLDALGSNTLAQNSAVTFDTSDDICADYIIEGLSSAPRKTLVVIDYLQLLDQNRSKPTIAAQILALKSFVESAGLIVIMLSQIDRTYDPNTKKLPSISDVRMPNPIDLKLFTKTIFINDGVLSLQAAA